MYNIPGTDAMKFEGNLHSQGGIMLNNEAEVEGGETMDKVTMKKGGPSDYIFSTYLNMDGSKGYKGNKETIADRHTKLVKGGAPQWAIDALAQFQEKQAGRSGNKVATAKHGGPIKYQTSGQLMGREELGQFAYTIQEGDRLDHIADAFKLDANELASLNNLANKDHIEIGQTINIPTNTTVFPNNYNSNIGQAYQKHLVNMLKDETISEGMKDIYKYQFDSMMNLETRDIVGETDPNKANRTFQSSQYRSQFDLINNVIPDVMAADPTWAQTNPSLFYYTEALQQGTMVSDKFLTSFDNAVILKQNQITTMWPYLDDTQKMDIIQNTQAWLLPEIASDYATEFTDAFKAEERLMFEEFQTSADDYALYREEHNPYTQSEEFKGDWNFWDKLGWAVSEGVDETLGGLLKTIADPSGAKFEWTGDKVRNELNISFEDWQKMGRPLDYMMLIEEGIGEDEYMQLFDEENMNEFTSLSTEMQEELIMQAGMGKGAGKFVKRLAKWLGITKKWGSKTGKGRSTFFKRNANKNAKPGDQLVLEVVDQPGRFSNLSWKGMWNAMGSGGKYVLDPRKGAWDLTKFIVPHTKKGIRNALFYGLAFEAGEQLGVNEWIGKQIVKGRRWLGWHPSGEEIDLNNLKEADIEALDNTEFDSLIETEVNMHIGGDNMQNYMDSILVDLTQRTTLKTDDPNYISPQVLEQLINNLTMMHKIDKPQDETQGPSSKKIILKRTGGTVPKIYQDDGAIDYSDISTQDVSSQVYYDPDEYGTIAAKQKKKKYTLESGREIELYGDDHFHQQVESTGVDAFMRNWYENADQEVLADADYDSYEHFVMQGTDPVWIEDYQAAYNAKYPNNPIRTDGKFGEQTLRTSQLIPNDNNNQEEPVDSTPCPCNEAILASDPGCICDETPDNDVPDVSEGCPCEDGVTTSPECCEEETIGATGCPCEDGSTKPECCDVPYKNKKSLAWLLPVIGAAAQMIPIKKALELKPRLANASLLGKQQLQRINYNDMLASNKSDTIAMNRFIDQTSAGPTGIANKMAAMSAKRKADMTVKEEESRKNIEIGNAEAQMNQNIAAENAKNILTKNVFNAEQRSKVDEAKVSAWDAFGDRVAGVVGDSLDYLTEARKMRVFEGQTNVLAANKFFRDNPQFIDQNGNITAEGQNAWNNRFKLIAKNQ